MTRLVGYQPQYFPRLHYFARVLNADIFTISDYLQYVRHHVYEHGETRERGPSYQAHTPIKTANGVLMLDVPIRRGGEEGKQLITSASIDYATAWYEKHLQNIEHHYKKSPEFHRLFPSLEQMMRTPYANLADLSVASIRWGFGALLDIPGVPSLSEIEAGLRGAQIGRLSRIVRMSESAIPAPHKEAGRDANVWIIETCKAYDADEYYFGGTSAGAYMDFSQFESAGIRLCQQNWKCEQYHQQFAKAGFIPNLSIIDLVMNIPRHDARAILASTD